MWMWRRIKRVSWMDKITNEEILSKAGEKRQLISVIRNKKKNWTGHVLRGEERSYGRKVEGKKCER